MHIETLLKSLNNEGNQENTETIKSRRLFKHVSAINTIDAFVKKCLYPMVPKEFYFFVNTRA